MADKKDLSPEDFRVLLSKVLEDARESLYVGKSSLQAYFGDYRLTEEQLDLVCGFLVSKGIQVDGFDRTESRGGGRRLTEEEEKYLGIYESDLAAVPGAEEGEWEDLVGRAGRGDDRAKRRITELFLTDIVREARNALEGETSLQDLIQEGNLRLVMDVDQLDFAGRTVSEVREILLSGAWQAMQALIADQREIGIQDRGMVSKVQDLKDGIEVLKEEYGRSVYLDEAADFMNISEEEAEKILRLAGEEVLPEESDAEADGR